MRPSLRVFATSLLVLCACSGGKGGGTGGGSGGSSGSGGGTNGAGGGGTQPVENCLGKQLLTDLGKTSLMVGMMTSVDTVATQAPWDVRYLYLSAGVPDGNGTCQSCAMNCTAAGANCSNAAGCGWWGCYQYDQDPPGDYVRSFVSTAKTNHQLPMITYYEELQTSLAAEGGPQVDAMTGTSLMTRYFADWRFMLQQIGTDKALLHVEPDLWGYAMQKNADPSQIPVAVASVNATDCGTQPNTFAGFGKCMIAMVRKYAPNARVGFHASAWMTGPDVGSNTDPTLDVVAEANKAADFLKACGADQADFVVVETSDRDAGYYAKQGDPNAFWDITNATLPNFHQMFTWAKAVAERVGRPLLWWQLPVGNMNLDDSPTHYRDNRVQYFFTHPDEVVGTHAVLMAFGPGAPDQTDPGTDNGNLIAKDSAYVQGGGQAISCPP